MAHYMLICQCGEHTLSARRSSGELLRWADRRGDCWGYKANGTPYWFLCLRCRMKNWPHDLRFQVHHWGPAPRPTSPSARRNSSGVLKAPSSPSWSSATTSRMSSLISSIRPSNASGANPRRCARSRRISPYGSLQQILTLHSFLQHILEGGRRGRSGRHGGGGHAARRWRELPVRA